MGCISAREKQDLDVQAKEAQLQIFLCTIENIRNGFFYLNEGDNITEEHIITGFQNMAANIFSKFTSSSELFKKFIHPFKQQDGTYNYRDLLICFYLNSRSKSMQKALAITEILHKNKDALNQAEIKEIFQRMFKAVFNYTKSLTQTSQIQETDINNKKEKKTKDEKNDEKKNQEQNQIEKLYENGINIEKFEEKIEEKYEETKIDVTQIEQVFQKQIEVYMDLGQKVANDVAESFLSKPEETMEINEFAEKCQSHIPVKFGRDIFWPKGIRLVVYEEFDKKKQQDKKNELERQQE